MCVAGLVMVVRIGLVRGPLEGGCQGGERNKEVCGWWGGCVCAADSGEFHEFYIDGVVVCSESGWVVVVTVVCRGAVRGCG